MNTNSMTAPALDTAAEPTLPWWRVGMVWLVIGGPLAVVVAALFTALLAVRGADPVIGGQGGDRGAAAPSGALAPAIQARNHAAKPAP
ncbi:MAG TPA: nitrogen fixation protein FixH [Ideonella sp.]|nr:nitrogen fixation protein FixH [Ideonella sp.]